MIKGRSIEVFEAMQGLHNETSGALLFMADIAEKCSMQYNTILSVLPKIEIAGLIKKEGRGVYTLTKKGRDYEV